MAADSFGPGGRLRAAGPAGRLEDTVLVSNRGPLAFRLDGGRPVPGPVGGGLAGTLRPLVAGSGATWVACAMGEADRAAAAAGLMTADGARIDLVEPDPTLYAMAYDVVSNATLWFCHHHLFDAARRPRSGRHWREAWDGYRAVNELVAARVAEVAPPGGRVLVQDYHLALTGTALARLRPDLRTVHFSHTPFADPSVLRMLPTEAATELLTSMGCFGACGFHVERWAAAHLACRSALGTDGGPTFIAPLSVDTDQLRSAAAEPAVERALAQLEARIGDPDRKVVVRVDRMELSKNLLRGFWAFDELLEQCPAHRGRVVFVALAYPTRQGLPEYLAYQDEVATTVDLINERWSTGDWTPVVLEVDDDYPRSLAALRRADVLLVNPVRDGLNLVAMEGPAVNERDAVLALSREAGAFDLLGGPALGLNPFDLSETAQALDRALTMDPHERAERSAALRRAVQARHPGDWLTDQLEAAG